MPRTAAATAPNSRRQPKQPAARTLRESDTRTTPADKIEKVHVVISAPKMKTAFFRITGTSPYMQFRFSEKAMQKMRATHEAGTQARSRKARAPRNFEEDYRAAMYVSEQGWNGIPAGAFRSAAVDVCRLVGYKMTLAKLAIFVEPDGYDKLTGKPLVRIYGTPEMNVDGQRNDNGSMDLRARPMWRKWHAEVRVKFDLDQFSLDDVSNLMLRAGTQNGIGEGRHNSRNSTGCGFGCFTFDEPK